MANKLPSFTHDHLQAMKAVQDGADVFSYGIALRLREVQRLRPRWIAITRPKGKYSGVGPVPYFGAILTKLGMKGLNALCWNSLKDSPMSKPSSEGMGTPLGRLKEDLASAGTEAPPICTVYQSDLAKALAVVKAAKALMDAPVGTSSDQEAIFALGETLAALESP